jgi:hypothetical protein
MMRPADDCYNPMTQMDMSVKQQEIICSLNVGDDSATQKFSTPYGR